ncbi:MAG: recombinase family protein [Clostridium sp.]|jgi:DNA invertase Pin-like site-specific DNA recombinase|nr:recombinase family protein [Clostridium sp.]
MGNIRVIPAKTQLHASAQVTTPGYKRRVAGYARVSTDKEEQENSFEAQVKYYTEYIQSRPDWSFVSVYTDEGISATSTKNRDGFNQMVRDALDGKLDLIVTKSVSRFARNTVDSLQTVRTLKEKGVEIYFEKEQIWTFDGKGELLITIMSSLAQEESRSISENVTWGQRRRFADGKVTMAYGQFLGYDKGEDGTPAINEDEAQIVRLIFKLCIEGKTPSAIAKYLTSHGIPSPAGKETWQVATVRSILVQEKYKGHALLQKTLTVDFLSKKTKVNEGEAPQYYVTDSHPAIISPDEFDAVQAELERRNSIGRPLSCKSPFATHLVCGACGGWYGKKVWGSYKEDKTYRREIWQCNDKYSRLGKPAKGCKTPSLTEDEIKLRFLAVWNGMTENCEHLIADCRAAKELLCDCKAINSEIAELEREVEVTTELSRKAIFENARTAQNQNEFNQRNNGYLERQRVATERIATLEAERKAKRHKARILENFIKNLEASESALTEFDETLWATTIDRVIVGLDGTLTFRFLDGSEYVG